MRFALYSYAFGMELDSLKRFGFVFDGFHFARAESASSVKPASFKFSFKT